MRKKRSDVPTVFLIAIVITVAAILGNRRSEKNDRELVSAFLAPGDVYQLVNPNKGLLLEDNEDLKGFIYSGRAKGYNGIVRVASVVDTFGSIRSVHLYSNDETPSFSAKIARKNFADRFVGVRVSDLTEGIVSVDAVAGATITSNAITEAIVSGYMYGEGLNVKKVSLIRLGWPEYVVLALFFLSVLLSLPKLRPASRYLKWIIWGLSILFLGFVLGQPITLPRFISLLRGYMPDSGTELYVLILPLLAIGFVLTTGKNVYCRSVCPFGATQEFLGEMGKASEVKLKRFRTAKYIQWGITLIAILLALIFSNPSMAEYSVFGAFFQLTGTPIIFILLMLTVIMSMLFRRPWCRYLCPVDGVMAYFRTLRRLLLSIVRK